MVLLSKKRVPFPSDKTILHPLQCYDLSCRCWIYEPIKPLVGIKVYYGIAVMDTFALESIKRKQFIKRFTLIREYQYTVSPNTSAVLRKLFRHYYKKIWAFSWRGSSEQTPHWLDRVYYSCCGHYSCCKNFCSKNSRSSPKQRFGWVLKTIEIYTIFMIEASTKNLHKYVLAIHKSAIWMLLKLVNSRSYTISLNGEGHSSEADQPPCMQNFLG